YFKFVRSGDPRPRAAVLEHNRLDLLSLAGLTARLLQLLADGPRSACDAREALALGRIYARSGLDGRAHESFTCVLVVGAPRATVRRGGRVLARGPEHAKLSAACQPGSQRGARHSSRAPRARSRRGE